MRKKKSVSSFILRRTIYIIVIVVLIIVVLNICIRSIKNNSLFELKEISANYKLDLEDFNELKGSNIFKINLKNIAGEVLSRDLYIYKVQVSRRLPDELYIEVQERTPFARVDLGEDFILDQQGVLLKSRNNQESLNLPLISGLRYRIPNPSEGKNYNKIGELNLALSLIEELKFSGISPGLRVERIDVSSTKDTSFYIKNGPQIKIGDRLFKERLGTLEIFLKQLDRDLTTIYYIDLRFKEPVVKLR